MTGEQDCIFCKIVRGTIPCFRLAEDDRTLAFMDINPGNPGHALVIPKAHAPDLHAVAPDDLAAVARMAQRVAGAVKAELAPDGINLVQANGPGAAQSVLHFHMHVLPRALDDGLKMNWGLKPGDMTEIGALAERLKLRLAEGRAGG